MNPPIDITQRLKDLDEIRQYITEKKQWLASVYDQFGAQQKSESLSQNVNSFLERAPCFATSSSATIQSESFPLSKTKPEDPFLHTDLIEAYHKLASKQVAALEASQSPAELKRLQRKKSKQKLSVYSKRLSYTEVVRQLIQNQNEVMANISSEKQQHQKHK